MGTKISELPTGSALTGDELMELTQNGVSIQAPVSGLPVTSAAINAALGIVTDGIAGFNVSAALGTTTDGRAFQLTATGVGATGDEAFLTNLSGVTVTGGSLFQTRTFVGQNDVRTDVASEATFAITNDSFVRLGFASGTPAFAVGSVNQAYAYRGHIANEGVITSIGTATGMANNGSGAIRVTIASTASLTTDQFVRITGTVGTTEANSFWYVTVIDATHFDLQGSTFSNAWVSGGTVTTGAIISDAVSFYSSPFDFEDANGATGIMRRSAGLFVRDLGHATKVVESAHGVFVTDMTGGAPVTAAYGSAMTSGTGKFFLRSTGDAPSSHYGALRVGFVGSPGTPVLDGQYQPGTLPAGTTQASQFYAEPTNGHSGGTSVLTNLLSRINASGTNNVNTYTAVQPQIDIANTAGTIANIYGAQSVINITPASGTLAVTSIRNIAPTFAFTGTGGTTTTATYVHLGAPNFTSGTHAVTTLKGVNIDDIGHASRVTNAIGIDIADITASATLTAGIRSVLNSGTGKWFIQHTGTAASTFGGAVTVTGALTGANVSIANTGFINAVSATVDFNSGNTDTSISIPLPTGYTRYLILRVVISNASASITTATCGVFPAAGGAGTAIVASGTAITVSTATEDTNNNAQTLTVVNAGTFAKTLSALFFRVQTPQGSAATGKVTVVYEPIS